MSSQRLAQLYSNDLSKYDFPHLTHEDLKNLHTKGVNGDKEAWQTLWMHGVRLVLKICNHMRKHGQIPTDDAYNECVSRGNVAIGEALLTWKPKKGRFATWVWLHIRYSVIAEMNAEISQGGKNFEPGMLATNDGDRTIEDFETFVAEALEDDFMGDWFLDITRLRDKLWILPDREARYVKEVYLEHKTQTQLAKEEGISVPMVNKVLGRAIARLSEALGYSVKKN